MSEPTYRVDTRVDPHARYTPWEAAIYRLSDGECVAQRWAESELEALALAQQWVVNESKAVYAVSSYELTEAGELYAA